MLYCFEYYSSKPVIEMKYTVLPDLSPFWFRRTV